MTIDELKKAGQIVTVETVGDKLVTETFTYLKTEVELDYIRSQRDSLVAQKVELEADIAEKEALLV